MQPIFLLGDGRRASAGEYSAESLPLACCSQEVSRRRRASVNGKMAEANHAATPVL
jgi:hypothetical protein